MNKFRNCICFAHPPICWQCHTLGGIMGQMHWVQDLQSGAASLHLPFHPHPPDQRSVVISWFQNSSILDCHHHLLLLLFCEFELPECCHFRLPPFSYSHSRHDSYLLSSWMRQKMQPKVAQNHTIGGDFDDMMSAQQLLPGQKHGVASRVADPGRKKPRTATVSWFKQLPHEE